MLTGRLFGSGETGVVLSHMGRGGDNQADWQSEAEHLGNGGYLVLTYNRQGICNPGQLECSEGRADPETSLQDALGAFDYIVERGAVRVFAAGASLGAMASLKAAELDPSIAGVIWLAGETAGGSYLFSEQDVAALDRPILAMAGDMDISALSAAQRLARWAPATVQLVVIHSALHGTDIIEMEAAPGDQAVMAIDQFLAANR